MSGTRLHRLGAGVSAFAGVIAYAVARFVFPYHSSNHDEGVYLQHAEMLLDGRLFVQAGELVEGFRPWFFVAENGSVYPKYSPVPSAVFAVGELLGGYRLSLAVVAALSTYLIYRIAEEAFGARVGLVAAASLLFSPLFVIQSGMFLPYAPTTLFNLGFGFGYIKAHEEESLVYAVCGGVCAGIAFFSRPYTAVLFALPFVFHSLYVVYTEVRYGDREGVFGVVRRYGGIAVPGLFFVGVTLGYNHLMTGDALVFPYLEFAPNDGLGFGERSILGYSRIYDPAVALEANARVLGRFVVEWGPGTSVGVFLCSLGLVWIIREPDWKRLVVAGVGVSVAVGNVYFWGNLNILGEVSNPQDGLVYLYGTFYHFDLLLPASVLIGAGVVTVYETVEVRKGENVARLIVAGVIVAAALVGGIAVTDKVDANRELTGSYETAYEPFLDGEKDLRNSIVFLPTPYGDWLNHPFQYLRNDADLNGSTVYAIDRGAENFEVTDRYPERDLYRYVYRGEWAPYTGEDIEPLLEKVRIVEGQSVGVETTFGVPEGTTGVSATVAGGGDGSVRKDVDIGGEKATVDWDVYVDEREDEVKARMPGDEGTNVSLSGSGTVTLTVDIAQRYDSLRYREELTYRRTEDGGVRVISPPYTELCYSSRLCDGEAAHVPSSSLEIESRVVATRDVPVSEP